MCASARHPRQRRHPRQPAPALAPALLLLLLACVASAVAVDDRRRVTLRVSDMTGDELHLDAGNRMRLLCSGEYGGWGRPLWSAPGAAPDSHAAAFAAAANDAAHDATSNFLHTDSANGNLTNLYCCSYEVVYATPNNVTKVKEGYGEFLKCVYVFVKDPSIPIVEPSGEDFVMVSAINGREVTLDCRPSSRDFDLYVTYAGHDAELKTWIFDSRRGFTKLATLNGSNRFFECKNRINNVTKIFMLTVKDAVENIHRPWLDVPLLARQGADMVVNCTIVVPKTTDVSITLEHNVTATVDMSNRKLAPVGKLRKLMWKEMRVRRVPADMRVCCNVSDHLLNANASCSAVEVLPPGGEPALRVRLEPRPPSSTSNASGAAPAVQMKRGPDFQWYVRVAWEGSDAPRFKLEDPDSILRGNEMPRKYPPGHALNAVTVSWQPHWANLPATAHGVAYQSTLVVNVPTKSAEPGTYTLVVSLGKQAKRLALTVTLEGEPRPHLLNHSLTAVAGAETRVVCVARAEPPPRKIEWFWKSCNGSSGACERGAAQKIPQEHAATRQAGVGTLVSTLTLPDASEGTRVFCEASNSQGTRRSADLPVTLATGGTRGASPGLVGGIVGVLALICGAAAACVYITLRQKRERRRLHCAGLQGLVACEPGSLDPTLPADEQAEMLPYVASWEFPREDLILGKQLGAGAFGVVMKAEARGIVDEEDVSTVAVKMVKRGADDSYLRALASELKILVHLGRHLNVVNLLGACTGRIMERELLVIVEYCPYGNLHNYLLRHREGFVDQVDPLTGRMDATLGSAQLAAAEAAARRARLLLSAGDSSNSMAGSPPGSADSGALTAVTYCPTGGNCTSAGSSNYDSGGASVPLSPLPTDDSSSSGGPQPLWRTLYRCDTRAPARVLCTADLLSWAYQVACGIQYLAHRKVLHGDLAARNVLLARDGIVKICDFGLARSMYKSDTYKKKGDVSGTG